MNHLELKGTHRQAGLQWGERLLECNINLLDGIPFPITEERLEYAAACIPVYRTYYPEILEELNGLAEGQHCDQRLLEAALFSMYAIPPASHCSCFAMARDGEILFGRNSDFLTALEDQNTNVIYTLTDGAYSFTGNTTSFLQMEDGVNQAGLAIGLTSVHPCGRKPGFHAGLLVRYFLEKCRTVSEVWEKMELLPIGSAQTLTVADPSGDMAVIECNAVQKKMGRPTSQNHPFVCATNVFHLPGMEAKHPEEDDWFAERRYQTMIKALEQRSHDPALDFAKNLLSGQYGFLCQYDRRTGKDTVWSVIYDLGRHQIYRSEANPRRTGYQEDLRFSF